MHQVATEQQWTETMARFRFAGQATALLVLVGWLAWFFPFDDMLDRSGAPLGGDYVMLYVAGQVVADGAADSLYDDAKNQQRSSQLFPGLDPLESWPYRYPPTVAAAMVSLSQLPLAWSFAFFILVQLSLLTISLWWLHADYAVLQGRSGWLWALIGSPLVLESLIGGQSSLLALACTVGFMHYLGRGKYAVAGMLLALTLYKPNVIAMLIVAALVVRPRLLVGFLPTLIVGGAVAVWTAGTAGVWQYVQLATQLASSQWSLETPFWKVHGLAPLFQWVLPAQGKLACALAGLLLSLLAAWLWRTQRLPELLAVALLLCCNALFNPYVPIYDLVLLELALVLFCQAAYCAQLRLRSIAIFQCSAALLFVGPHLSQALARTLGINPFPLVLVGGLVLIVAMEFRARYSLLANSPAASC